MTHKPAPGPAPVTQAPDHLVRDNLTQVTHAAVYLVTQALDYQVDDNLTHAPAGL